VIRHQWSPGKVEEHVRATAVSDGDDVEVIIEQEPGSSGISLIHHYRTNVLPEFLVTEVPVVTNKLVRAQPFLAAAESGKVFLLSGSWNEPFKREFDSFPGGAFDDQVDTAGAGYQKLSGKKIFSASWGRTVKNSSTQNHKTLQRAQFTSATGHAPRKVKGAVFGRKVLGAR
jgi:predicted phage terminase large subunit-like protein